MKILNNGVNNIIVVPETQNVEIKIQGNNNKIIFSKFSFKAKDFSIEVIGDNNTIDIGRLRRVGILKIVVKNGGSVYIGEKSTFELTYILSDTKSIRIGKDNMVAENTSFRNTDMHGIYDIENGEIINNPENIILEDHIWVDKGVTVFSGSYIGGNSVIEANTHIKGVTFPENVVVAGIPAKIIRENIVWDRRMTANLYFKDADYDPFLKDSFNF